MEIKIRGDKNKMILVGVNHVDCKKLSCFIAGRYTHHSAAGLSGCSSWTDKNYSCLTRNNHGCPDIKTKRIEKKEKG